MPLGQASTLGDVSGTGRSGLERHKIVVVEPGKHRDPNRRVHLTPKRGKLWRDAYPSLILEIEQRWLSGYGANFINALRESLESLDSEFVGELPNYPNTSQWLQNPRLQRREQRLK